MKRIPKAFVKGFSAYTTVKPLFQQKSLRCTMCFHLPVLTTSEKNIPTADIIQSPAQSHHRGHFFCELNAKSIHFSEPSEAPSVHLWILMVFRVTSTLNTSENVSPWWFWTHGSFQSDRRWRVCKDETYPKETLSSSGHIKAQKTCSCFSRVCSLGVHRYNLRFILFFGSSGMMECFINFKYTVFGKPGQNAWKILTHFTGWPICVLCFFCFIGRLYCLA